MKVPLQPLFAIKMHWWMLIKDNALLYWKSTENCNDFTMGFSSSNLNVSIQHSIMSYVKTIALEFKQNQQKQKDL